MLAIADQFPEWKDFPRGLRVMLVDEDVEAIDDVKKKLEANGYVVTCYCKGVEALQALADRSNSKAACHVVVVDASRSDSFDGFEIVAAAKHLTTIMMASTDSMNIMMQGIAAGASEILHKPLSEERLKNIWQHVVRKALVTGHFAAPTSDIAADAEPFTTPPGAVCEEDNQTNVNVNCCTPHHDCKPEDSVVDGTHGLVFQEEEAENHDGSSYFDMDEKTFLCCTPPQLEQTYSRIPTCTDHEDNAELTAASPAPSHSQDFSVACMQRELNEIHECFDDCDSYLHMKSAVEEAVNNSAILNELFESKTAACKHEDHSDNFLLGSAGGNGQVGMAGSTELSSTKFCDDLEFDGMDDITEFSGDLLDDGNGDQSLSIGFDCFDDEDFQEADEEALLLAEVEKAEMGMLADVSSQNVNSNKKLNHSISKSVTASGSTISNHGHRLDAEEPYNRCKSDSEQSCNIKGSKSCSNGKKKMKVDWTPELHRRFVQAVEQLGVDKAIPSRILDLMGVKCLTRHNIASHLQKYRSHRKHLLAREVEAASWNQRRQMDHAWRPARGPKPPQPAAPTATAPPRPPALAPHVAPPALHVWGHPSVEHALHFWPAWPGPPACPVDAWGNPFFVPAQPILRVPLAPMPSIANIPPTCGKLANLHPPKEMVVAAINEVLRNPYTPLPLGLKPPSLDSVVSELQRQGIGMAATPIT